MKDNLVNVGLYNIAKGKYVIGLYNLEGKLMTNKTIYINSEGQSIIESLTLRTILSKGLYQLKITGADGAGIFAEQIMVK